MDFGNWRPAAMPPRPETSLRKLTRPGDAGVQKPVPDSNFKSLRPLKRRMGASNWPWMRPSVKSVQSAAKKVLIST